MLYAMLKLEFINCDNMHILKKIIRKIISFIFDLFKIKLKKAIYGSKNKLNLLGSFSNSKIEIWGDNNTIEIGLDTKISDCLIFIKGDNNKIKVDSRVTIYNGELWIENNQCLIEIGEGTTIQKAHIASVENESEILIGKDCMISTDVEIRTSDSHSIIDILSNKRFNPPSNILLKDHVWLGSMVKVLKGVTIETGSIVGTGSIVTKSVSKNILVAGVPAKIIKENVNWFRERM